MKTLKIITVTAFLLGAFLAQTALADKGGKGKGHKPEQTSASHEEGSKGKGEDENLFGFNDDEVKIITGILKGLNGDDGKDVEIVRPSHKHCPPGLAKKNNGCMPPGLAKKYTVGERLSDDSGYSELSDTLRKALGIPPKGKKYVQVDNDVLLIEEGTKLILDSIGLK